MYRFCNQDNDHFSKNLLQKPEVRLLKCFKTAQNKDFHMCRSDSGLHGLKYIRITKFMTSVSNSLMAPTSSIPSLLAAFE